MLDISARRVTFMSGLIIADVLAKRFGSLHILYSDSGVREGYIYDKIIDKDFFEVSTMQLSTKEQQQLRRLLKEAHRPGMVLWTVQSSGDNVIANGYAQGDPIEIIMMTIHAVDFAAQSLNMTPEQVLNKIAAFLSTTDHKPTNMSSEPCNF